MGTSEHDAGREESAEQERPELAIGGGIVNVWGGPDRGARFSELIAPGGDSGSAWYVGITGNGKTALAARHARVLANRTCYPILLVDSEDSLGAEFPGVPVARRVGVAVSHVWGSGSHCRWIPSDPAEIERVAEYAHELCRVVLLVDESSYYLHGGTRTSSHLLRLIRAHRHAEVFLLFTTQHFSGDIPQAAFGGAPPVYVFQTTSPAALKRLREDWGIETDAIRTLPPGRCVVLSTGRSGP